MEVRLVANKSDVRAFCFVPFEMTDVLRIHLPPYLINYLDFKYLLFLRC